MVKNVLRLMAAILVFNLLHIDLRNAFVLGAETDGDGIHSILFRRIG